jgi:hypothetical protein
VAVLQDERQPARMVARPFSKEFKGNVKAGVCRRNAAPDMNVRTTSQPTSYGVF